MRRVLAILAALFVLPGCAGGAEADRAQDLLKRADAGQAALSSMAYTARVTMSFEGRRFDFAMEGAAVLKGAAAGDQWLRMTMPELPGLPAQADTTMVVRDGVMTMSMLGRTQRMPMPAGLGEDDGAMASLASLELARCVESVRVTKGTRFEGEPASRISGTVDSGCVLDVVGNLSGVGGLGADLDFDELGLRIGDVRATLYVSDRSHLLVGGVISLSIDMDGHEVSLDVVYRLRSVNQPVRFPQL